MRSPFAFYRDTDDSLISKFHQALDKLKEIPDEKHDSELGIIINRYGKREDKSFYLDINR
jgi:hypothetical protein